MKILNLKEAIRFGLADPTALAALPELEILEAKAGEIAFRGIELRAVGVDKAAREITYASSVEIVDRMGDLIIQSGWDTKSFEGAGAPFFWNHQSYSPPVGGVRSSTIGEAPIRAGSRKMAPALIQRVAYLGAEVSELGDLAFRMASGEGMPGGKAVAKGVSVGFIGSSSRRPSEDEQKDLGMPGYGLIFERQEQLELSQAPVPANPAALPVNAAKNVGDLHAADERAARKAISEALNHLVAEGHAHPDHANLFRSTYGLTPSERLERSRARVKSFQDLGTWSFDWQKAVEAPEPADEPEAEAEEVAEVEEEPEAKAASPDSQAAFADALRENVETKGAADETPSTFIGVALTTKELEGIALLRDTAAGLVSLLGDVLGEIEARAKACVSSDSGTIMSRALADTAEIRDQFAELRTELRSRAPQHDQPLEGRQRSSADEEEPKPTEKLTPSVAKSRLEELLSSPFAG